MGRRLVLIGCGKAKRDEACAAEELYTGPLFRARATRAKAGKAPWWIVSAKHGLVDPWQVVEPYDVTLGDLPRIDRAAWALHVVAHLLDHLDDEDDPARLVVELHMGRTYFDPLRRVLEAIGATVEVPTEGLSQGRQLQLYAKERKLLEVLRG